MTPPVVDMAETKYNPQNPTCLQTVFVKFSKVKTLFTTTQLKKNPEKLQKKQGTLFEVRLSKCFKIFF